jgi:hypothetical protein
MLKQSFALQPPVRPHEHKTSLASSAPAEPRGDKGQDCLNDMRVIRDAKLIWDRQQKYVRFRNDFVALELLDQDVWFSTIVTSKD